MAWQHCPCQPLIFLYYGSRQAQRKSLENEGVISAAEVYLRGMRSRISTLPDRLTNDLCSSRSLINELTRRRCRSLNVSNELERQTLMEQPLPETGDYSIPVGYTHSSERSQLRMICQNAPRGRGLHFVERTGSGHSTYGSKNTLADLVRIGAFIPCNVKGRHDKEIRRPKLKSGCDIAGRITLDRRNRSSIYSR